MGDHGIGGESVGEGEGAGEVVGVGDDFDGAAVGVDDPGEAGTVGEVFGHFAEGVIAGVVGGEDFDGEVGGELEEFFVLGAAAFEAAGGDEGDVRREQVAGGHAVTGAGAVDAAKAGGIYDVAEGDDEDAADVFVFGACG